MANLKIWTCPDIDSGLNMPKFLFLGARAPLGLVHVRESESKTQKVSKLYGIAIVSRMFQG